MFVFYLFPPSVPRKTDHWASGAWHRVQLSVTLRSLSRLWTSWPRTLYQENTNGEDVPKSVGRTRHNMKHMWSMCAYVECMTSCQSLPSPLHLQSSPPLISETIHISFPQTENFLLCFQDVLNPRHVCSVMSGCLGAFSDAIRKEI